MTHARARHLFAPKSVAIVGQSNDATKTAGRPLKFLRQAGYAGRIYPVNARRDEVLGERACPSLAALPEVPEHAYIVANTEATIEAIEECGTARRAGRHRARQRLRRGRRRRARARDAAARDRRHDQDPHRRAVEPRRGRPAAQNLPHRQRCLRRKGFAGRPHLRRLALRRHDRHVPFARKGARYRLCRLWFPSATRPICRSARSARRRSTIPASTATCCSSKPCAKRHALRAFALEAAKRGKPVMAYKLGRSEAARELAVSAHRRAGRRGRHRRRVPRRVRHRAGRTRWKG